MRVMTYNVLAQAYIKRERYPDSPPEALEPARRRAMLLERLDRLEADVLLLQEVEPELHQALRDRLSDDDWAAHYVQRLDRPDGCAIYARRAVVEPQLFGHVRYRHHEPRGSHELAVWMTATWAGQSVGLASTHLRWQRRDTPDVDHLGRLQLAELLDHCALHPEPAWLVGGDFNAWSQDCVLEHALARGWRLSCRSQRPWDTTHINGKRRKLDYLLYRPEQLRPEPLPLRRLERATVMPSLEEPSDHLPVVVDVSLAA